MSDEDPGLDARFDRLRRAHESERPPDGLRRRLLDRAGRRGSKIPRPTRVREWLSRGGSPAAAAGVAACLWLGLSRFVADGSVVLSPSTDRHDLLPSAEPARSLSGRCPSPLPMLPWNAGEVEMGVQRAGFEVDVFESETDCGPLKRRFLVRAPVGVPSSWPVLIVLHDAGETAEMAQRWTSWWFDDPMMGEPGVVYANGSQNLLSTVSGPMNAGVWQTDEGTHPAVDDGEYLRNVVDRLRQKRNLAGGEVFLAGYGSGALMALVAAMRHPELYAGVAAFLPPRLPWKEDLGDGVEAVAHRSHLQFIFIELPNAPATDGSALATQWASALGLDPGPVRVMRGQLFDRVDSVLETGTALRIVRHSRELDPSLASDFDAPAAAWEFFHLPHR